MSDKLLEMKHVTKRFPGVIALDDVMLDIEPGEIHAICGENGAGKSTLMKVLSGSYTNKEYEGEIWVNGKKQRFSSVADAKSCGIEMVYQELNMMLDISVAENIFVGNLPGKGMVDKKKLYADTQKILDRIHLNIDPISPVRALNSGQMQMLAIMRALTTNPRIMVLDEPTTALAEAEVDLLFTFLDELRKAGVSCLLITHKLEEVFRFCDRVTVMRDGHTISTGKIADYTYDKLVEEMIGRKIGNMYPKKASKVGSVVMRVESLSVPSPTNRKKHIVENIGFELHQGEIFGIGGLVGAGRSEILGAVFGAITENVHKKLYIDGKEVEINSPREAINLGLGFVTEERKRSGFINTFSVMHNLSLVALKILPKRFFISRKAETESAEAIYSRLGIKAVSMQSLITSLSGGNQQKVVLGKWLMKNPRILLVDEPTKGVDVGAKAEIYEIMRELTASGVSIIMVSSDMPELVSMSDRCIVISGGKVNAELTGTEITQENVLRGAIATA